MNLWDRVLYKMGRPFSRLFVAGEELEDALGVAKELNEQGLTAIINFLGEEAESREQAYDASVKYAHIIWDIWANRIRGRVSIKPSQLGLKIDKDFYWDRLKYVAQEASLYHVPLEIDIEGEDAVSQTIETTIKLVKHFRGLNVRQALAMNFKNSFAYLYNLTGNGVKVRLCKGAYPSEYIDTEIEERYMSAASYLLRQRVHPEFATHDLKLCQKIIKLGDDYHAIHGSQFLWGLIWYLVKRPWGKMTKNDKSIALYLPFGTNWLPYAKRRWKYIIKKIPALLYYGIFGVSKN